MFSLFLVAGCSKDEVAKETVIVAPAAAQADPVEVVEEVVEELVVEEEIAVEVVNTNCALNSECLQGDICIEGECGKIASLSSVSDDCQQTCTYASAVVKTSDGETYTFPKGKGSYTSAGQLAWKLKSGPDYCIGEDATIAIEIEKRNYGKVFEHQTILLPDGGKSDLLTHPTNKKIQFTLEIESVTEVCN